MEDLKINSEKDWNIDLMRTNFLKTKLRENNLWIYKGKSLNNFKQKVWIDVFNENIGNFEKLFNIWKYDNVFFYKRATKRLRVPKEKVVVKNSFRKYEDENWKKVRHEVFERDGNKCIKCNSTEKLHCHHTYYLSARKIWDYPLSCFETLCSTCHENLHKKIKGNELVIKDPQVKKEIMKSERREGFISNSIFKKNQNRKTRIDNKYMKIKIKLK